MPEALCNMSFKVQVVGLLFTKATWLWGHQVMDPTDLSFNNQFYSPQKSVSARFWHGRTEPESFFFQKGAHFLSRSLLWTNCLLPPILNINAIFPFEPITKSILKIPELLNFKVDGDFRDHLACQHLEKHVWEPKQEESKIESVEQEAKYPMRPLKNS